MRPALVALCLASLALPASAQMAPPKRKPGYWETRMTMPGMGPMTSQLCTDAAWEEKMSAFSQQGPGRQQCSPPLVAKTATGFSFQSSCTMGGRTTTTRGTASGDFNSAYTMDLVSQTAGGPEMKMRIAAKWLGACPAGKKPGDMSMNGRNMNMGGMGGMGAR